MYDFLMMITNDAKRYFYMLFFIDSQINKTIHNNNKMIIGE